MITLPTKSANYDPENIKFFQLSFTICHIFALEINYFPVMLSVHALLARLLKRNKRKIVSGTVTHLYILLVNLGYLLTLLLGLPLQRVTLPPCKQGLSTCIIHKLTLSFLCGICLMFVQEGPLFVTRTSHKLAGKL